MNRKNKRKIIFLIIQISLICSLLSCKKNRQDIAYKIIDDTVCYSSDDINVKISMDQGITINNENEIIIYDYRNSNNPGIKILNSYKINNIKDMSNIIKMIKHYNNEFNTENKFIRSGSTMLIEWLIHNICYYNGINIENTKDTDFNNNEFKYFYTKKNHTF